MHIWYPESFTVLCGEMLKSGTVFINFWVPPGPLDYQQDRKVSTTKFLNLFCDLKLGSNIVGHMSMQKSVNLLQRSRRNCILKLSSILQTMMLLIRDSTSSLAVPMARYYRSAVLIMRLFTTLNNLKILLNSISRLSSYWGSTATWRVVTQPLKLKY